MLNKKNPAIFPPDFLGAALNSSRNLIFLIEDSGEICYVNHPACELLGYSSDDLLSMSIRDIDAHTPGKQGLVYPYLLKEKGEVLLESRYQTKDGAFITVEVKISHFVFSDVVHYLIMASSLGLENSLSREQEWVKTHFSETLFNSADWLWEVDQQGRYTFVSSRVKDFLGYEPDEIIGKTPFDFMSDDEASRVGAIFANIVQNKEDILDLENWNRHKDGKSICLLTNGSPILNSKGELLGYRGVDKDITHRKQAEQAISNERSLLRSLIDSMPDPVYIKNNEDIFIYCNDAYMDFVNKPVDEIIGKHISNVCDFCEERCFCKSRRIISDTETTEQKTYWVQCPDREKKLIDSIKTPCFSSNGELLGVIGVAHDITEFYSREESLRQSEERLLLAQSIAHLGNWDWDIEQETLHWSDEIYRIFGQEPQIHPATYEGFFKAIHPDDREYVTLSIQRAIDDHQPYAIDHRIIDTDGNIKMVREQGTVFFDDAGKATRMSGTVQDISKQHYTEQLLKKRLKYEVALAECSRALLSEGENAIDVAMKCLLDAAASSRIYIFKNFNDPVHGLSASYDYEACAEGVAPNLGDPRFKVFHYADGEIYKKLHTGQSSSFTQETLTEREQNILRAQDVLTILLIPVFINEEWYGFIGLDEVTCVRDWVSDEVLMLRTAADMFSSYFLRRNIRNALLDGYKALELEVEEHKQDIDILGKNLSTEIAIQKKKELELKESQERFNQLANNTTEGFWITEGDNPQPIYVNKAFFQIWGISSKENDFKSIDCLSYMLTDDRKLFSELVYENELKEPILIDYQIRRNDGSIRWLRDKISPILDEYGKVYRIAGVTEDVTDQKEEEKRNIEEAQKQRDSLVREVHHRIKNHLQGITGLLINETFKNPQIKDYLDNAINQINAIATIHGLQGRNISEDVDLQTLLKSIINSLEVVHLIEIQMTDNLPDSSCICLKQSEAVPVSLILNEIMQNAIKHSVQDQNNPTLQVEIHLSGEGVTISVHNTAEYCSSPLNIESASEKGGGLTLIRSMMPAEGALFSVKQDEETFTATLKLQSPVVNTNYCR